MPFSSLFQTLDLFTRNICKNYQSVVHIYPPNTLCYHRSDPPISLSSFFALIHSPISSANSFHRVEHSNKEKKINQNKIKGRKRKENIRTSCITL
ncbi:hypothetical protein AX774_g5625 [Zancudomyces culisetae]|uniref:Uncharacterized protein n=1 Tax=Zancudomyces culisetae TaxID=1213189 RepID=A0A1R1PIZ5_ZANCU|nr:hypothetical protein AX774_g5625 [Zancudomyces culisetae]|eukprot:OMH80927.1 hypothetical protein AX774_g5625 [Zancudomyces culisetae]